MGWSERDHAQGPGHAQLGGLRGQACEQLSPAPRVRGELRGRSGPPSLPQCMHTLLPTCAQEDGLARGFFQGVPLSYQGETRGGCTWGPPLVTGLTACPVVPKEDRGKVLALGPWLPPLLTWPLLPVLLGPSHG